MDRNLSHDMNGPSSNVIAAVIPMPSPLTVMVPPPGMAHADIIARNRANIVTQYLHMPDSEVIPPPKADYSAPPPYDVAANSKLPTYEEVEREKHLQGEGQPRLQVTLPPQQHQHQHLAAYLAMESVDGQPDFDADNGLLGTDFMFFTAFFVAFLFNWIGFLLLMCFCHTIASRYGALSGFGLSLAKWTFIVKHSTEFASHENAWLCWLIMAFGLLLCLRAIVQYLNIKRGWRLLSGNAQERLLFFN